MLLNLIFSDPVLYVTIVLVVMVSVVLHELAHGFAAIQQGDRTPISAGHMTLDPVVHMGPASLVLLCVVGLAWGQMPVRPGYFRNRRWGEAIVSGAGPATNLGLALLSLQLLSTFAGGGASGVLTQGLYYAAFINFQLFFLNLMPLPPLDGYNVFSSIFPGLRAFGENPQVAAAAVPLMLIFGSRFLFGPLAQWAMCAFGPFQC